MRGFLVVPHQVKSIQGVRDRDHEDGHGDEGTEERLVSVAAFDLETDTFAIDIEG